MLNNFEFHISVLTCIDLTAEDDDDGYVDLTSVNDSSVVVGSLYHQI